MCKTHGGTPDRDKNKDGRIMTVLRLVRVEQFDICFALRLNVEYLDRVFAVFQKRAGNIKGHLRSYVPVSSDVEAVYPDTASKYLGSCVLTGMLS